MIKRPFFLVFTLMLSLSFGMLQQGFAQEQNTFPWEETGRILEPAELADRLNADDGANPLIFNLGPVDNIKGAIHFGALTNDANKKKLVTYLENVAKDREIVIYCGCCPFTVCPNIRPAYAFFEENGFEHFKVLNLEESLNANWIAHGYPMEED